MRLITHSVMIVAFDKNPLGNWENELLEDYSNDLEDRIEDGFGDVHQVTKGNLELASGWGDTAFANVRRVGNLIELRVLTYNRSGGDLNIIATLPSSIRPTNNIYTYARYGSGLVPVEISPTNGNVRTISNIVNDSFIGLNITYFLG